MNKIVVVIILIFLVHSINLQAQQKTNNHKIIDHKVDSVLKLMTIEEKIGQLNQISSDYATGPIGVQDSGDKSKLIKAGKVGSILNALGAHNARKVQRIAIEESRLGIPLIMGSDVIHGYKTIFPIPLAESASWDLMAMEMSARVAAIESSVSGINWTFAPMVDISRDPRWGRIMEGAGEDPYLCSEIAKARIKGFQTDDLGASNSIMACAKHFAGYGASIGGRDYNNVDISKHELNEIYLRPFKVATEAGVATFMNAFNDLFGVPCTANDYLLKDLLKGKWNFKGFVVSDWGSIQELVSHGYAENSNKAAELAFNAGTDMDMASQAYLNNLKQLIDNLKVTEKQLDESVKRILKLKFRLGLFDNPYLYCNEEMEKKLLMCDTHLKKSREVARKSIVLLKNKDGLLPLSKKSGTIAVIGPLADSKIDMLGEWSCYWKNYGGDGQAITLLEGIKNKVGTSSKVLYAKGCEIKNDNTDLFDEALTIAKQSDVIVLAIGETANMSGEGTSRGNLNLSKGQLELVKAIKEIGKPVVVVLMNGRPLLLNWINDNVPAILETWLLGSEAGNAIADVIFGDYNPSGKLPVSFPYSIGQIPVYYNYKNTGRPYKLAKKYTSRYMDIPNTPLFPFGYGLSYTNFEYSNLNLNKKVINMSEKLQISVTVKNTGNMDGEEVIQLYICDLFGSVTRPVKELKGFKKVLIQKGETKKITFSITKDDLAFFDTNLNFKAEAGKFKIYVGTNSVELLEAEFEIIE